MLFIFSSYALYKSQTENSSMWRTDEIAHKTYDFHKLKEKEEAISADPPQGTYKNYSNSDIEKPATAPESPNIKNGGLEPSTAGKINSAGKLTKPEGEWPFSTYKKIIYFNSDGFAKSQKLPGTSL